MARKWRHVDINQTSIISELIMDIRVSVIKTSF